MTNEKARDFFSAYYEGTLEPGLSVSLAQRLKADSTLSNEYASFARAMDQLGTLKFEEIASPDDLNEKISARLDRYIYDQKRSAKPALTIWLRNLGFGTIAAAAIIGAVISLRGGSSSTAPAGVFNPPAPASDKISYSVSPEGVTVKIAPATSKTIIVTDDKGVEKSREVAGDATHPEVVNLLKNDGPNAAIFQIRALDDPSGSYVAIPGKVRTTVNAGEGTIVDLAQAMSNYFGVPVSLKAPRPAVKVAWTFASHNPVEEAGKALGPGFRVTLLQSDILQIEQN